MGSSPKRLACCTVCDETIFEVVSRHMEGLFAGEVKQVGNPLPGTRRCYLVRASGRQTFWSLCASCVVTPENVSYLHKKELAAMVREGLVARDNARQAEWREKMLRLLQFDVPIGVLGIIPWSEVK